MKVEFYNATRRWLVPVEESAMQYILTEFNRLAKPNRTMDLSDFLNPDYNNPDMEDEPEYLIEDFAEWLITAWEWANMTRDLFDESSNIQAILALLDSLVLDTDGDMDDWSGSEDWDPLKETHQYLAWWKGYQS